METMTVSNRVDACLLGDEFAEFTFHWHDFVDSNSSLKSSIVAFRTTFSAHKGPPCIALIMQCFHELNRRIIE